MAEKAAKVFGGAKVIYIARFEKETAQKESDESGDIIERPWNEERGDLIRFYSGLTNFNSYHARCLRVKSDTTVNLGLDIIEDEAEEVEPGNDPENDVTQEVLTRLSNVNEFGQSFQEVISRVSLDFETVGNGYVELARDNSGKIAELYHAPAVAMKRYKRGHEFAFQYDNKTASPVNFFQYKPGEDPPDKDHNEMIHFQNYTDQSRVYGLPDWRGAVPDIEVDYYAVLYNQKFFLNSGIPDLAIITEGGKFDEETEKLVQRFFQTQFKGVENAHRTLYLPINDENIKIRFEKLALDVKDRDGSFDKLRSRNRDNIVSAHGVPPRLVGIVESGQLGGGGEIHGQLQIFQEVTIGPRQTLFETKLNPLTVDMGIASRWKFVELDTKIREKDSELYPSLVGAGILTVDEAREDLGRGPMPEDEEDESSLFISPEEELIESLEKFMEL